MGRTSKQKQLDWRILFKTLLSSLRVKFDIEITDTQALINTTQQDAAIIKKRLEESFQSSTAFMSHLPYTITTLGGSVISAPSQQTTVTQIVPAPDDTVESGKRILMKLFSADAFDAVAFDPEKLFNQHAKSTQRVLYSKPVKLKLIEQAWNSVNEYLISFFHNVSIERIREAWLNDDKALPPPAPDTHLDQSQQQQLADGLIQQCFGVLINKETHEVQMFFDYGRLHEFLFQPLITLTQRQDAIFPVQLAIDRNHLLSYMQQITQNGILLRISATSADQAVARPIFFTREATITKPHHYIFILDESGSMAGLPFEQLKEHVINFIAQLKQLDENATVRIVFFADDMQPASEFSIKDTQKIIAFINKRTKAEGNTKLNDTLLRELKHLVDEEIAGDANASVFVFTDGGDNRSTVKSANLEVAIANTTQAIATQYKLFTLGYGKDVEVATLRAIAGAVGTPYIHIQDMSQFTSIYQEISTISTERDFVDFMYQLDQSRQEFTIPLERDNSPFSPEILIPMSASQPTRLTYAGRQLEVQISDQALVERLDYTDLISELTAKAHEIMVNATPSQKWDVNAKLQPIINTLQPLATNPELSPQETSLVTDLLREINEFKTKFTSSDAGVQASVQSMARTQQGFMPPSAAPRPSYQPASHSTPSLVNQ